MRAVAILVVAVLSTCFVGAARADDLLNIMQTMMKESPALYQGAMDEFIAAAKKEDLDAMLALTSPITREQQGDEALKTLYKNEYVLMFKILPKVSEGGSSKYVDDHKGTVGWIFTKEISNADGKSLTIYVVTLKESGKIYVSSLGVRQ